MNKATLIIIIVIVVGIAGFWFLYNGQKIEGSCTYVLLKNYDIDVQSEQNARDLINQWINVEYTPEQISEITIAEIERRGKKYLIELTTALPQRQDEDKASLRGVGYRDYKIENGQIFGRYCSK